MIQNLEDFNVVCHAASLVLNQAMIMCNNETGHMSLLGKNDGVFGCF